MQNLLEHLDKEAFIAEDAYPADAIDSDLVLDQYYYDSNDGDLCWVTDCDDPPDEKEYLAPRTEKWEDIIPSATNTKFTIDSAKVEQWDLAKAEFKHIINSLSKLTGKTATDIDFNAITKYICGLDSSFAKLFKES